MKPKPNGASRLLQQRLDDSPGLPALTRHVMKALAYGDEAARAWRVLGTGDDMVYRVCNRVRDALTQALHEAKRPDVKDEKGDLARIKRLAKELKREIVCLMPGDSIKPVGIKAGSFPPIQIEFGWHSLRPDGYGFGYPLAATDMLDLIVQMATDHATNLPVRAVTKNGIRPKKVRAFVRNLAWQFSQEFGQEMRGTIGYIATAVFDLADPLSAKDVEVILKDRPPAFKTPT